MALQIRRSGRDVAVRAAARFPTSFPRKCRRVGSEGKPPPPISKLGDDLLVEILLLGLRNPRYAGRCKLVCKRWASLISDPSFNRRFISHHRSINEQPPLLLTSDDSNALLRFVPMPVVARMQYSVDARKQFSVSDCFKDLLLCRFQEVSADPELDRTYIICNPFTEQWIALPLAPVRPEGSCRSDARLVCEPLNTCNLELGDGKVFNYSSEYRFRVLCIYQLKTSIILDMFCSESGKWTEMALHDCTKLPTYDVASWDGELFLSYFTKDNEYTLAAINPFHLLERSIPKYVGDTFLSREGNFSVSQGALHIVVLRFQREEDGCGVKKVFCVWRLNEDPRKGFTFVYEKVLETSSSRASYYDPERCEVLALHPEKPNIVYLQYFGPRGHVMLSLDMTGEGGLKYFGEVTTLSLPRWRVFEPRVSCWPTPIPRYEKLQSMYV